MNGTTLTPKRGRPITGRVFKRGDVHYLRFQINGKEICRRLLDPETQLPCTSEPRAKLAADIILQPYRAAELGALREQAARALQDAHGAAVEAERIAAEAKHVKTKLADAWEKFPAETTRPSARNSRVRQLKLGSVKQHRDAWGRFTLFMTEKYPAVVFMEDVTTEHCQAYANHVLKVERLTHHTYNWRVRAGGAMYFRASLPSPFDGLPIYGTDGEHETREPLTLEEARKVCTKATGDLRLLLTIGYCTGLRLGDACTLTWDSIRLEENRLSRKTAKRGKPVSFPIAKDLGAALEEIPPAERTGYVLPRLAALYQRDAPAISKMIRKHFEGAELVTQKEIKDSEVGRSRRASVRGYHAFRHAFASVCARAGIPSGAVADWLGHSEIVDRAYQHFGDTATQARILDALPSLTVEKALPTAGARHRDRLHELVRTLPVAAVKRLLKVAENEAHA